jgi:hypothetical protein
MLKHFTAPRMATVAQFFRTNSDAELFGTYAWCQAVSSGLFPILGDFEVALRNALHVALSQHYGGVDSFDWMMKKPNPAAAINPTAKPLPAAHPMKRQNQDDVQRVVDKVIARKGTVTPDDVVAALPFGFWEQIINSMWHGTYPAGFQVAVMSRVFPHAPNLIACPYAATAFRNRIVKLLTRIRETRNRIGHHDSIWTLPEFGPQGNIGFLPRRPRHTINSLKLFADRVCWFAGWISPAIPAYIQQTDHWWSFQALLSQRALAIYRVRGGQTGTYKAVMDDALRTRICRGHKKTRATPRVAFLERLSISRYHY